MITKQRAWGQFATPTDVADLLLGFGLRRPSDRLLDPSCGDGALLKFLHAELGMRGYGIDNDPANVLAAIQNGVNVLHLDLEKGLAGFEDDSFDHVIMSLSLQTVRHTVDLLLLDPITTEQPDVVWAIIEPIAHQVGLHFQAFQLATMRVCERLNVSERHG